METIAPGQAPHSRQGLQRGVRRRSLARAMDLSRAIFGLIVRLGGCLPRRFPMPALDLSR